MTPQPQQPNPNELLLITREELERCCSQMSAAGYKVSANYVEASVLSRPAPLTQNDNGDCLIICRHCGKVTQVQCNEAAQAHKDVLDKLREWSIVQYEISGVIDTMTLKQKIESLRTGGERR